MTLIMTPTLAHPPTTKLLSCQLKVTNLKLRKQTRSHKKFEECRSLTNLSQNHISVITWLVNFHNAQPISLLLFLLLLLLLLLLLHLLLFLSISTFHLKRVLPRAPTVSPFSRDLSRPLNVLRNTLHQLLLLLFLLTLTLHLNRPRHILILHHLLHLLLLLLLLFLNDLRNPLVLPVKPILLRSLDLRRPSVLPIAADQPVKPRLQLRHPVAQALQAQLGLELPLRAAVGQRRRVKQIRDGVERAGSYQQVEIKVKRVFEKGGES